MMDQTSRNSKGVARSILAMRNMARLERPKKQNIWKGIALPTGEEDQEDEEGQEDLEEEEQEEEE